MYTDSNPSVQKSPFFVFISLFFAMAFEFFPWPAFIVPFKPVLPLLLLIYWTLYAPKLVGFTVAIVIGVLIDLSNHTLLGFNVVGCIVVVYLTTNFYTRFVLHGVIAQSFYVFIVMVVSQMSVYLLSIFEIGFLVFDNFNWKLFYPSISSAVFWIMLPLLLQRFKSLITNKNKLSYD